MKPIYMSPSFDQADIIKKLLKEQGIAASLIRNEDATNALAPSGITWFELWLKRESDTPTAEILIEQHEFARLKSSLQISWEHLNFPPEEQDAKNNTEKAAISYSSNISDDKRDEIMQAAYDSWLPVNNKKVFQRLASMMGFSDDEIETEKFNNIRRPWNPDRLKSQVEALQQLCKNKSRQQILGSA